MKILIFTCRFGQGHYSVAEALSEKLTHRNHNVFTVDLIDYLFPVLSKKIYDTFEFMVSKHANIYNRLNKLSEKSKPPFRAFMMAKLKNLLTEFDADIIISTFPICSKYVSEYKKYTKSNIKLYTYITDVYPQEEWICPLTNRYFVASFKTKEIMSQKGIDPSIITITGIPVRERFIYKNKKSTNKKINVLIMGGGLGLIPVPDHILSRLAQEEDIELKILVGKNEKLLGELQEKYPNISCIGYTEEVEKYLKDADVLITKAGGITVFESISIGTPLCVIKPFLVQEVANAHFVLENDLGIVVDLSKNSSEDKIIEFVKNKTLLKQMHINMKKLQNNLEDICPKDYYVEAK